MKVTVKVKSDHLQRLSKVKKPLLAVAELIWNGLDADANEVRVVFDVNSLGGLDSIRVIDDGHGMNPEEAISAFESLGGSWKTSNSRSKNRHRMLHGKAGKGRFRAYSLGGLIQWHTSYQQNGRFHSLCVSGSVNELGAFEIGEPESISYRSTGTEVVIANIYGKLPSLQRESAIHELTELFALYLMAYPDVAVWYDGVRLDPKAIEANTTNYDVGPLDLNVGGRVALQLTVIEWKVQAERGLFLCDASGFGLQRTSPGIQAPGFHFTAYLRSDHLRQLDDDGLLDFEEMHPDVEKILSTTKAKLRDHFRQRAAEHAALLVESWKAEEVYPYEGEPQSILEGVERQVFDVCAINVNEYLPEFDIASAKSKRFTFTLLKEALKDSPESLQRILNNVLELSKSKQEELAHLLERTTLSAIINASKTVADRLDFLQALEILVFDPESRQQLLERSQLHRILVEHTWLFGEEYHLSVDDQSLSEVLKKHLELLGRDLECDAPVVREDGRQGIVDLMLSRRIPRAGADQREHLVIELKRPKQAVDAQVANQIKSYALAVARDERFRSTSTTWTFWAVSNDVAESVRLEASQPNRPEGVLLDNPSDGFRIWVKTWGQLIESCRARLQFFREQLEYSADRDSGLQYLREVHQRYLPDVLK